MSAGQILGLDFAWSKPDAFDTYAKGYRDVFGYISHDSPKNLGRADTAAYRKAGLRVHFVFEDQAGRALLGAAAGRDDGAFVESSLNYLGENLTSPVFFAVDESIPVSAYPAVHAYASEFNLATRRPVGIYGSFAVVEAFVTPGQQPVRYGWQTSAWSGFSLSQKADIYQRNHHTAPLPKGATIYTCDEDVIIRALP